MLQIRGSSIIMISTPGSDNHLFSKLMKARRNNGKGDLYFRNHEEEMICTSCEARGVKTCCSHNQHKIPSWISLQRQEDLRGLMGDEMFEQEIGGKQLSDKQPDFNPKLVLQLESKGFESVRARKYGPPKVVIVAIDPTGGGRSKMAICSFIVGEHGDIIIVGAEEEKLSLLGKSQEGVTRTHLQKLRQSPFFASCVLLTVVEAQLSAVQANDICKMFNDCGGVVHLQETKIGGAVGHWFGVDTTPNAKERIIKDLQNLLYYRNISIAPSDEFISSTFKRSDDYRDVLCEQFRAFGWVAKNTNRVDGSFRVVHTGKTNGGSDDSLMALGLGVTHGMNALRNPFYQARIREALCFRQ
eukprot:TRINITY_DN330_c0_g1_i1.p1 TRINITY_DN330_c0_g1~~TRINITY_DN330_c0_g1_i1.p1  ORF type:complete len:356 (+),score=42.26 TRINITY_DN330_c0_g1_i1:279-1346(+)